MLNPPSPDGISAAGPKSLHGGSAVSTLVIVSLSIAALYVGRDILIPLALAILLSFAIGPIVIRLERWRLGRVPSVLVVVCLAFLFMGGFAVLVGNQLVQLVKNLPTYQYNIHVKIQSLQSAAPGGGMIDRAATVVRELSNEVAEPEAAKDAKRSVAPDAKDPIPVRIEQPSPSMFTIAANIASPLLGPIGSAGLVIVFVFLMLLEREDLRSRLIRLIGGGDLYLTTEALDDAAKRVSRYLLMQLIVNVAYGLPLGVGLYLIGVPNALLWGVLATVLRFLPYIGPFIAALFPVVLALAVDPGWSMLLWTVGLFLILELISNNVIEPWLYGASTGVSAIAIILAAIFWTTLWGPIGLLLSTPLTVCLVVMGRYIPQLRFLDVLLGSEPVLTAQEHLYQRMLAGDSEEGEEIVMEQLKERKLAALYDEVILPALCMAERDRQRKFLTGERRVVVTESFLRVVTSLADHESAEIAAGELNHLATQDRGAPAERADNRWSGKSVLCIAGWTPLDRVAAAILAQRLERHGIGSQELPAEAISPDAIASLDTSCIEVICLVYLSKTSFMHARQACLRVRRHASNAKVMVAFLNGLMGQESDSGDTDRYADIVTNSLFQAFSELKRLSEVPISSMMVAPPPLACEPERLSQVEKLGILDTEPEEHFDRVTRRLAEAFDAPMALLTIIDAYRQFWKSSSGLPEDLALARESPRETSICGHVVASNQMLVIEDVLKDKRFANNPFLRERGIRFYAGAPLCTPSGHAIGSLCVLDTKPRKISSRERSMLQIVADEVMSKIQQRTTVSNRSVDAPCPTTVGATIAS